jgi:hypothetical protein
MRATPILGLEQGAKVVLKIQIQIFTAFALIIVPLSICAAQVSGAPPQACPDLPEGLWTAICDAQYSAQRPGDYPYSINYCCVHSARDFHEACKRANLSCYTIHIYNGKLEAGHALNLVEEPKGTCRFVDTTGIGVERGGAIIPPRIGDITFPCDRDPPQAAICSIMREPPDCEWRAPHGVFWIPGSGSVHAEPQAPWTYAMCKERSINVKYCAQCCTKNAEYFYRLSAQEKPPLDDSGIPPFPNPEFKGGLEDMTRAWQRSCLYACDGGYGGSPEPLLDKNPGARFAIDFCGAAFPIKLPDSRKCIVCCVKNADRHSYPPSERNACEATCRAVLDPPVGPPSGSASSWEKGNEFARSSGFQNKEPSSGCYCVADNGVVTNNSCGNLQPPIPSGMYCKCTNPNGITCDQNS